MTAYRDFASVYDLFMEDVPYDEWSSFLISLLRAEGIEDGLICELGCGTGNLTERLARAGYDMIGIDASEDMLAVAQKKEMIRRHPELREEDHSPAEAGPDRELMPDILYLQQDMRSFELYGTVRAVVSVCDSLNYITNEEELLQMFRLVNNYLDPGGLFLFDMNTPACYEAIGDQTIAENRPEGSFIWENMYDPETQCNEYDLTLFLPVSPKGTPETEGLYRKREETHVQRGYPAETICRLLEDAGLQVLSVTEAYTGRPAGEETARLLFAAREVQKKN